MNTNQILTNVLFTLVLSCFSSSLFAQGTWASKPAYGGAGREGAVSFSIGSNIYMGTGLATGGVFKDDLWQYNGTAWTQMANFPGGARSQAVGFTINNKGYIGTGYLIQSGQNVNMRDLWEFSPSTNTWVQKQSLPTTAQGRSEAVAFSIGGKGYITTGYYYSQPTALGLKDTWEYDPSLNNWTQKADYPGGFRYGAVGFAANSRGYVGTGRYADPNPPYSISYFADFWEYNPTTNQWVQKTSYPGVARHRSVGFQLCNYGYIGIGQDQSGNSLTDFYRYDATVNTWSQVANYGGGYCYSATAAVMNNKGYVGTGKFSFGAGQIFQEYTPATACVNPCALNSPAGADKNVCSGSSVQIGSTPQAGYLYSWSPATGLSSATIGNPLASPTATTTYVVSVSNSAGCFQTDTVVVTVKTSPTANAGVDKTICAGNSTTIGTAAVTGNTYLWSPSTGLSSATVAIPTANPTVSITYTLTVTNTATGCSAQDQVAVTVLAASGSAGADKTICAGLTTTIGPAAVTGTFYSWSPATGLSSTSVANPVASPSVTTNYILYSQNSGGCTSIDTVKVIVNPLPTANAGLDQSICFGTGATIGSNAVTGMTYSWSPSTGLSSTTIAQPFAQPSSTITYTLTVTNTATGCTKQDAMILTVLPGPVANAGVNKTICAGASTTIGSTAVNGVTYSWSPSTGLSSATVAVPTANPTVTTTYILTAGSGNCTSKDTVIVTVNPLPTANAGLDKSICGGVGVTIGTAAVTGNTYSWSPSTGLSSTTVATPTATPTTTTTYTLTVTNTATGCTKTDVVIVSIGTAPTANAGLDKTICAGASTTIGTAAVTGNTYSWSPSTGLSSATLAVPSATPTATTTYTLTVTNTASGCTSTDAVLVTVNPLPTANAGLDKSICGGGSTTIGTQAVTGLTYSWSPSTGLSSATVAVPTATPIATTTYTLTVTNTATGCIKTDVVIVSIGTAPTANAGLDKTVCTGGNTTIGTAAVTGNTYSWSPSTGLSSATVAVPTATPTATTTYTLTVTNTATGCTSTDAVVVTVGALPTANAGLDKTVCAGASTTIGTAAVTGVSYAWSPTTGLSSATVAVPTATPTATTNYILTVTNAAGCTKKDTVKVIVNPLPTANAGLDKAICGGSTTIGTQAVTGNTYSWSPSTGLSSATVAVPTATPTTTTTYTLTVTNTATGCTNTDVVIVSVGAGINANAGVDKTICGTGSTTIGTAAVTGVTYSWTPSTGLSSATVANPTASPTVTTNYILTASSGGCTSKDTVKVTVAAIPTANAGLDKTICAGVSTTIGTTAVTGNTYAWSPSTGLSSATIAIPTATPTATTNYILTVTNAAGCTKKDTVKVNVNPLPTANAGLDKAICGGSTTIGTQAVTGMTYSWTPSTGLSSATVAVPTATPTATTTYTLTVTNTATGCTNTDVVIVTVGAGTAANAGVDKTICGTGGVSIGTTAVTGVTYSWTPATGLSSTTVSNPIASPTVTTNYILTTSNGNCSSTDTVKVTVSALPTANAGLDKSICAGTNTTIGTTAVTGNTYSWTPATGLSSATIAVPTVTPTATTNYIVTVTNAAGCTKKDTVKVTVNPLPTANAGVDKSICGGVGVTIGTQAVTGNTYSWTPSTGLSSATIAMPLANPNTTTTYTLTVTNTATGCTKTDIVIVTVGVGTAANAGADKTICGTGSVSIGATAVTGITYSWTPSTGLSSTTVANPVASPTVTTNYILTTSSGGCTSQDTVKVTVSALPTANAGVDKTICNGASTQIGSASVTGLTYSWTPATGLSSTIISNPIASPIVTTNYIVTVTNSAGCSKKDTIKVNVSANAAPVANAGADKSICSGECVQIGSTAVASITYTWTPTTNLAPVNASNPIVHPTTTTAYVVTAIDPTSGCFDKDTVIVNVIAGITSNAGPNKTISAGGSTPIGSTALTGVVYVWTPATGLNNPNASNPIASPGVTTTYVLTAVSSITGCSSRDTMIVFVKTISNNPIGGAPSTSTKHILSPLDENLQVYPNPVNESLNVNSLINLDGKYEVVLYNALAQIVYQADMNLQSEVLSLQIPVQSFSKGMYQLVIRTDEMEIMRKVVKE